MKKLIDHYKEWVEKGRLPKEGLCESIPRKYSKSLYLFEPTLNDAINLEKLDLSRTFWGSGLSVFDKHFDKCHGLTPLRETIILLICAMHDEI
jgi:hypothetical protein